MLLKRENASSGGDVKVVDLRGSGGQFSGQAMTSANQAIIPLADGGAPSVTKKTHMVNQDEARPRPKTPSAETTELERMFRTMKDVYKRSRAQLDATRSDAQRTQELCMYGMHTSASSLGIDLRTLSDLNNKLLEKVAGLLARSECSSLSLLPQSTAMVSSLHVEVLSILTSVLENLSATGEVKSSGTSPDADAFKNIMSETIVSETESVATWAAGLMERFITMINEMERLSASAGLSDEYISKKDSLLVAIQTIFITLGDTMKAKGAGASDRSFVSFAALYYYQAYQVHAPTGSLRKRLAGLHLGAMWETASLLGLSLVSVHKPSSSRDLFLTGLDRQRIASSKLVAADALSYLSPSEHGDRFVLSLQACLSIVLSRADVSQFEINLQNMKKHLSSLLLLRTSEVSNAYSGTIGLEASDSMCDAAMESGTLGSVENLTMHGLTLILSTAELLCRRHNLHELVSTDDSLLTSSDDETNRSAFRRLNEIRVTPGLIDIGRVITGFILALSGGSGLGMYSLARDTKSSVQDILRFQITLPCIGVFLEWFSETQVYRLIPMLDESAWGQLENGLMSYAGALRLAIKSFKLKSSTDYSNENQLLPEDFWFRGVSSLDASIERRFHSAGGVALFDRSFCFEFESDLPDGSIPTFFKVLRLKLKIKTNSDLLLLRFHRCVALSDLLASQLMQVQLKKVTPGSGGSSADHQIAVALDCEFKLTCDKNSIRKIFKNSPFANKSASLINAAATKDRSQSSIRLPGFFASSGSSATLQNVADDRVVDTDTRDFNLKPEFDDDDELFALLNKTVFDTSIQASVSDSSQSTPGMFKLAPSVFDLSARRAEAQSNIGRSRAEVEREEALAAISASRRDRNAGTSVKEPPLIVLDVPNIAMRHGLNAKFSCKGVKIAFDFFLHTGHKVIGFLPVRSSFLI
jgi:hypothetical protein